MKLFFKIFNKKSIFSLKFITFGSIFGAFLIVFINFFIVFSTKNDIKSVKNMQKTQTGLILGAGVYSDGSLSDIYRDRVQTAVESYKQGKIQKIIISGDNSSINYNEIIPARDYLLSQSVAEKDIFLDYAGFDTYDSLFRANYIFEADEIAIFTQEFHLPRAVYICKSLEYKCQGIISDKRKYAGEKRFTIREFLARIKAFYNVIFHSHPHFLGEKIPITGKSNAFDN